MYVDGLREWKKRYGRCCYALGYAIGLAEAYVEEYAEGMAEGVAEGELKNQKATLADILEDRFGVVPQSVRTYLDAASDLAALRRLTKSAWRAESLDAFLALFARERREGPAS